MIGLKPGVTPRGIQPELVLGLMIADGVYARNHCPMTVTALTDGKHMAGSRHCKGQAADVRTRDISFPLLDVIVRELKEALGTDYDVVLEDSHIHLEYQEHGTK